MKKHDVFIISRRAWEQDDLDYGTFEVIFVTTKEHCAISRFRELKALSSSAAGSEYFKCSENNFEYCKGKWFYQYKLEGFILDQLSVRSKKDIN